MLQGSLCIGSVALLTSVADLSCDQCRESLPLSLRQADITSEAAFQFDVGLVFFMCCSLQT